MRITGSHTVPVPRQRLWDAFHDPDLLRRALPGCSSLQGHEAGRYTATVHVGVPCVEGLYHADLVVTGRKAPESLTLSGSLVGQPGEGRGSARLELDDTGGATTIGYDLDAEVTGTVSRVGRRLLESAVQRTIAEHLDAVARELDGVTAQTPAPVPGQPTTVATEMPAPEPATVTFAPAKLRRDHLVTVAVAVGVAAATAAYVIGRRSAR